MVSCMPPLWILRFVWCLVSSLFIHQNQRLHLYRLRTLGRNMLIQLELDLHL